MDGLVVTGSVHTANWGDICEQLLGWFRKPFLELR
ncbi:hypothetical protein Goshw_001739 [Gossypium schwendimanii]|uniref:Uncharacterized protein n=1 Tax=Gossypium schwendimanii TaxID=34291 RepID=A0A7J9LDB8_GOSSC|nr:hypothetical protein [Gossypium schwendimanii]